MTGLQDNQHEIPPFVKCRFCQRVEVPGVANALRDGWPMCCGETMVLHNCTPEHAEAAANEVIAAALSRPAEEATR